MVIWQINVENAPKELSADEMVVLIKNDYNRAAGCKPRLIQIAHNGHGSYVAECLRQMGLPVEAVTPSDWRQRVPPELNGPNNPGETGI